MKITSVSKCATLVAVSLFFLFHQNVSAQDPNLHIYICFGQSNMEGQGPIESQDKIVDERFKVFQALDCPGLGREKADWFTAVPPTCQCESRLSPADYFGRTMIANLPDSITVGIINVAVGGCDIRLFDKDIYADYDSTYTESWFTNKVADYNWNPYQYIIDLAKLAQQDGVIKGILLHQGETNTGQTAWPSYVEKIYNDMLSDLSLHAEDIPLLAGEVLATEGNCCASMNPIINKLPEVIPNSYVISSEGCTGQDEAHFDSKGYRKLGRRYAVQMLALKGYEAAYAEVECATVGDNWKVLSTKNASNKRFLEPREGTASKDVVPADEASSVQMTISVNSDTTYYFYGRMNNPTVEGDALWIKIDEGDFKLYDDLTTSGWEWMELANLDLTAGEHTITVAIAEEGTRIDKFALKNSNQAPVSVAEEAANLCTIDSEGIVGITTTNNGYALHQNFPNPTTSAITNIPFVLPTNAHVTLKVYNSQGAEVDELAGKEFHSGEHVVEFNLENLTPGIYFYTIVTDKFSATRKMIISTELS